MTTEDEVHLAHRLSRLETYVDRQLAITHLAMACMLGMSAGALAVALSTVVA